MQLIDITPKDDRFYDLTDLANEIWKPVVECPDCYLCSNYSRIKTLPRNGVKRDGIILKQCLKKDGYYQVVLQVYGKRLYRRVNRVIAEAFVPNPDNKPICDHIDDNPLNNKANNLQWLTTAENIQKYVNNVYDGRFIGRGKIQPKKVIAKKDNVELIFDSVFQCAMTLFGVKYKRSGVSKACRTGKKYLGWTFSYQIGGDV